MNVEISAQNVILKGELRVNSDSSSVVIFAQAGSNIFVANQVVKALQGLGVGTLCFELITGSEIKGQDIYPDVDLLTERLIAVTKWCLEDEKTKGLNVGYFGFKEGTAVILSSAAYWGTKIKAMVSLNGKTDMAMDVLDLIEAPTLFIVGGEDKELLAINRQAYQKMGCVKKMEVFPGGMNLFGESMETKKVSELSMAWLAKHLGSQSKL